MNYAEIKYCDIANGSGTRTTLFVSGCTHHCAECFQPQTWNFDFGEPFTRKVEDELIESMRPSHIRGLTLLGGEPMEKSNQEGLLPLVRAVRQTYPDKTIWCFTGYDFEKDILGYMIEEWETTKELISYFDVMVDGEFQIEHKDLGLAFKGSSNQRTIMVQESLQKGRLCIWQPQ